MGRINSGAEPASQNPLRQVWMFGPNPPIYFSAQLRRQRGHLLSLFVGNRTHHLVTRKVPLLPKGTRR
jgi:hypothetical protein